MKKLSYLIYSLIVMIVVSTITPGFALANSENEKDKALSQSVLYNLNTEKLEIDDKIAQENNLTKIEIADYENKFDSLTKEETSEMLLELGADVENIDESEIVYQENEDGEITPYALPLVYLAGIGLVSIVGYFFWDDYMNYKTKKNLIDKCYAKGGNPVIDSRDSTGLKGEPKKGEVTKYDGFNFACEK